MTSLPKFQLNDDVNNIADADDAHDADTDDNDGALYEVVMHYKRDAMMMHYTRCPLTTNEAAPSVSLEISAFRSSPLKCQCQCQSGKGDIKEKYF